MVTGDHLLTAKAIATECNILTREDHVCIEGSVFSSMSEEEKLKLIPNLRVMARSSPTDKYELVKLLRSKVAVQNKDFMLALVVLQGRYKNRFIRLDLTSLRTLTAILKQNTRNPPIFTRKHLTQYLWICIE